MVHYLAIHQKFIYGPRDFTLSRQIAQPQVKQTVSLEQWEQAQEEISRLSEVNEALIREREDLNSDLDQLQEKYFALQPHDQISDDSIQKDVEKIHGAIDGLIYDIMVDAKDDALYRNWKRIRRDPKKRKAAKIVRRSDMHRWSGFGCSNFLILSAIIQWILHEYIFRKSYPLSITSKQEHFLREVEKSMTQSSCAQGKCWGLQLKRSFSPESDEHFVGQLSANRWRFETMTALLLSKECEKEHSAKAKKIHGQAEYILSAWLGGSFVNFEMRLQKEILDPAITVHKDFRASIDQSQWIPPDLTEDIAPREMIEQWKLKDVESWAKIKKEQQIGQALHCLHPALVRFRPGGGAGITLVKPIVVTSPPRRDQRRLEGNTTDTLRAGVTEIQGLSAPIDIGDEDMPQLDTQDSADLESADTVNSSSGSDSDTTSSRLSNNITEHHPSITTWHYVVRSRSPENYSPGSATEYQPLSLDTNSVFPQERSGGRRREEWSQEQSRIRYDDRQPGPFIRRAATFDTAGRGSKDTTVAAHHPTWPANDTTDHVSTPAPPPQSAPSSMFGRLSNVGKKIFTNRA